MKNLFMKMAKAVAPGWVVKNKTVKTKVSSWSWVLDNFDKELEILTKKDFDPTFIKARRWSLKMKCYLIEKGVPTLLDEMNSGEEISMLVQHAEVFSAEQIVSALRVCTPPSKKLKELINVLVERKQLGKLLSIIELMPQAFNDLKAYELFDLKSERENPGLVESKWDVAKALATQKPEKWVLPFMCLLKNIAKDRMGDTGEKILTFLVRLAIKHKLNISEMMSYLYDVYPNLYVKVRMNMVRYDNVVPFVRVMLTRLSSNLSMVLIPKYTYDMCERHEGDAIEAWFWLKIACDHLYEKGVQNVIADVLSDIANLDSKKELYCGQSMVSYVSTPKLAYALLNYVENDDEKRVLYDRILNIEETNEGVSRAFLNLYPFKEMNSSQIGRGVKILVDKNAFPVERLGELHESWKDVVTNMMETRSQVLILKREKASEWSNLFSLGRLTPEAECVMLSAHCSRALEKVNYIETYKLADSSFKYLLEMKPSSRNNGVTYVSSYVRKWGLTEEQYLLILQSQYADMAPYWKSHVKH